MDVTNGSSIREPYVSLVESHGLVESHYLESCILLLPLADPLVINATMTLPSLDELPELFEDLFIDWLHQIIGLLIMSLYGVH
jgi:hypothetical protein